jgi:ATP-dependent DNA helicase RecG
MLGRRRVHGCGAFTHDHDDHLRTTRALRRSAGDTPQCSTSVVVAQQVVFPGQAPGRQPVCLPGWTSRAGPGRRATIFTGMARRLAQLARIPVTELKGVSAERGQALAEQFAIESVLDLVTHYPRRYLDRTRQARIADLEVGEEAMVLARVVQVSSRRTRGRPPKILVTVDIADGSGGLRLQFFNQPWRAKQLTRGTEAVFFGKVDTYRGRKQMTNPVVDLIGDQTGRIVPVYPQSEKARITSRDLARWVAESLRRAGELVDPLPGWVTERFGMVDRTTAVRSVHAPDTPEDQREARRRLVLDELLRVQLALVERKRHLERTTQGLSHDKPGDLVQRFWDQLPFHLTDDQQ